MGNLNMRKVNGPETFKNPAENLLSVCLTHKHLHTNLLKKSEKMRNVKRILGLFLFVRK